MDLYPRQIAKVTYEAIRSYRITVGQAEGLSWEATRQAYRDEMMLKVEALLRGQPHAPRSIRPSDQVEAKLLAGIVGAFVQVYNPAPVQYAPAPEPEKIIPIPAEVFPHPDAPVAVTEVFKAEGDI